MVVIDKLGTGLNASERFVAVIHLVSQTMVSVPLDKLEYDCVRPT